MSMLDQNMYFKDKQTKECLCSLYDKQDVVPAEKASNNIVFVCKKNITVGI